MIKFPCFVNTKEVIGKKYKNQDADSFVTNK